MRRTHTYCFLLICLLFWMHGHSQDVTLAYQTEVDAFDPAITTITGFLLIQTSNGSTDPITDLSNLSNLTSIIGDLIINNNAALTQFDGLSNLTSIEGNLQISLNAALTQIDGLSNLTSIGKSVSIISNAALTQIDGLSNLTSIGEFLFIISNNALTQIDDLSNLTSIGKSVSIISNNALTQIDGLSNLTSIGAQLEIRANSVLTQIDGLSNLTSIAGYLSITSNFALTQIDGLSNLTSIGGWLGIYNNSALTQIDGLSNLTSIGGWLNIRANDALTQIDGLSNLSFIGGDVGINHNLALTQIDGLSNLTSIRENLEVNSNYALTQIDGLSNLTSIGENLEVNSNHSLTHIDGLSNLTSIRENLEVNSNYALTQIDGLSNLTSIGGWLDIRANDALTQIDGLSNLTFIGGDLQVRSNDALTSCCGIHDLLNTPGAILGSVLIFNNPSECSSEAEVKTEACGLSLSLHLHPPCIDAANGSMQIQMSGFDTLPFNYQWTRREDGSMGMGSSGSELFSIDNLYSGTYDITVTTPKPDTIVRQGIILSQILGSVFEVVELTTNNSSNGLDNGGIQISWAGGNPPFSLSWAGLGAGGVNGINQQNYSIPNMLAGTYNITVSDDGGQQQMISVALLDETVPVFPCTEPLDIVILNDVSGSVDGIEYQESQQFIIDFLAAVNLGSAVDESRASIIEWSSQHQQQVRIHMTGQFSDLQTYMGMNRAFNGGTNPQDALLFGEAYLSQIARPDVSRVLILSTDGSSGQVSPSLVALADRLKAEGYHIMTIAFDAAFASTSTRKLLSQVASIDVLAPGAPAYSQLDQNLAENIVNLYLCPIDPGSSATAYFNRDGAIDLLSAIPVGNCPYPDEVELTFSVEALRELSIPAGTPITFYNNDPSLFGATPLLTWLIPCAIPVGAMDPFTITVPVSGPGHLYALLNDDGSGSPPVSFPITLIEELAYSNNVDDLYLCLDAEAALQAIKSTTTPQPICDSIVIYTVDVCNISEVDAFDVEITDLPPPGCVLVSTVINDNGCALSSNGQYDIVAGCCVSLTLTYDASAAAVGNYTDQDVHLSGPANQTYYDFDGAPTTREDVLIDGTIDCGSTTITFTKSVNTKEACYDTYVVYTFTIDNQLNIPLYGLEFKDVLPSPAAWVFKPYNLQGLKIGNGAISGTTASFIIDVVEANTVATFSMDAYLGDWSTDGNLVNSASLGFVPDLVDGGLQTLTSNTVTTVVTAAAEVILSDTVWTTTNAHSITLDAGIGGPNSIKWTTSGDGLFTDSTSPITDYIFGVQDSIDGEVALFVSIENDCGEYGHLVLVIFDPDACFLQIDQLILSDCDDQGTDTDASDDTYEVTIRVSTVTSGESNTYTIDDGTAIFGPFTYGMDETIILPADGATYTLSIADTDLTDCHSQTEVSQESCVSKGIYDVFIPNAFTPNGDGINDVFKIYPGPGISAISQVKIFDRWGALVHERDSYIPYTNSPIGSGWNGTWRGKSMDSGVFIYVVTVLRADSQTITLVGDVTLLR